MKQRINNTTLLWLPLLLWVVIVCYLSFSALPAKLVPSFSGADKLGHFGMYIILECFIFLALRRDRRKFILLSILGVAFAAFTELVQNYLIVNRFGDPFDFVANFLGILVAFIFFIRKIKI